MALDISFFFYDSWFKRIIIWILYDFIIKLDDYVKVLFLLSESFEWSKLPIPFGSSPILIVKIFHLLNHKGPKKSEIIAANFQPTNTCSMYALTSHFFYRAITFQVH